MIQPQADNSIDKYRDRVSKFSSELDLGLALYIAKKSLWHSLVAKIDSFSLSTNV